MSLHKLTKFCKEKNDKLTLLYCIIGDNTVMKWAQPFVCQTFLLDPLLFFFLDDTSDYKIKKSAISRTHTPLCGYLIIHT